MEVAPCWILLFNELQFPFVVPFFELLLALDGRLHCVVVLVPDEIADVVLGGEALDAFIFMSGDAIPESRRDADVNCSVAGTCDDVDGGLFFVAHGEMIARNGYAGKNFRFHTITSFPRTRESRLSTSVALGFSRPCGRQRLLCPEN
jgi:hypothetical protein